MGEALERGPMSDDSPVPAPPPGTDTTVPHSARIWNYWLGGTDNYPVDREAGDQYREVYPQIVDLARASRAFQARAVRFLAAEAGLRQFLDVGAGLPAAGNTHEVAQAIAPRSRVVYVDHDPFVVSHGRGQLSSTPEGCADYAGADLHQPAEVLRAAARTLDFTHPVALLLMGVMGHLDDERAYPAVRQLLEGLPPGSYLALQDGAQTSGSFTDAQQGYDDTGAIPYRLRRPEQIAAFFDGLEIVAPGVVPTPQWRPEPDESGPAPDVEAFSNGIAALGDREAGLPEQPGEPPRQVGSARCRVPGGEHAAHRRRRADPQTAVGEQPARAATPARPRPGRPRPRRTHTPGSR